MDFNTIVTVGAGLGIAVGLAIHFTRQKRLADDLGTKIRAELTRSEFLSLPELVTRVGLKDGFLSRGKLMNALQPMVAAGEVIQEEPPGTTVGNRLQVLQFRMPKDAEDK